LKKSYCVEYDDDDDDDDDFEGDGFQNWF
jgi:hypothetical protein